MSTLFVDLKSVTIHQSTKFILFYDSILIQQEKWSEGKRQVFTTTD